MTGFNMNDFENDEVRLKLLTIINDKLRFNVLKKFSQYSKREQVYFNETINEYLRNPPKEDYLEVINKDFNTIMHDVLTSEDFKAELQRVQKSSTNPTEVAKDESVDEVLARLDTIKV